MPGSILRRAALAGALLICAAALVAGPAGAAVTRPGRPAPAAGSPLLLIDGTRLLAGPGQAATVLARPRHGLYVLFSFSVCADRLTVPMAALPYLGRGLDPSLFQIAALRRAERAGRLYVRIGYQGRLPGLPGVTITASGHGQASGYLTAASARRFGAALARQYRADHARGQYGGRGLFAAGVSIALAGAAPLPRPRPSPAFPMGTLTVTGTNASGRPDTGDMLQVFSLDDCVRTSGSFGIGFFYHGASKLSVPVGHYWAVSSFGTRTGFAIDVLPQFTVRRATTVAVSARAATSAISFRTPRPATPRYLGFGLIRTTPRSSQSISFSAVNASLRVNPVAQRPALGSLRAYTQGQLVSPPGPGIPYSYSLDYPAPRGTIPPQRYTVRAAGLAAISERFDQDRPSAGTWYASGGNLTEMLNDLGSVTFWPRRLPGQAVLYVTAGRSEVWQAGYHEYPGGAEGVGGQATGLRSYRPAPASMSSWN